MLFPIAVSRYDLPYQFGPRALTRACVRARAYGLVPPLVSFTMLDFHQLWSNRPQLITSNSERHALAMCEFKCGYNACMGRCYYMNARTSFVEHMYACPTSQLFGLTL